MRRPITARLGRHRQSTWRATLWGNGVYKSTNAGNTWKHMGLPDSRHIARIVIHPTNPDIVYVAAMGHQTRE